MVREREQLVGIKDDNELVEDGALAESDVPEEHDEREGDDDAAERKPRFVPQASAGQQQK